MANVLERLTEGTVFANKAAEGAALVSKWEKSGLLEGISDEHQRNTMSTLLENQAKELLREANVMTSGDVQGFAAVAFPIVRRVFAGLIANDLVSVQPMSLPSGLVFFMDFRYADHLGLTDDKVIEARTQSLYGDKIGQQVREGVNVDGNEYAEKGFYALTSGYGTARITAAISGSSFKAVAASGLATAVDGKLFRFDPDVLAEEGAKVVVFRAEATTASLGTYWDLVAEQDLTSLSVVTGALDPTYSQFGVNGATATVDNGVSGSAALSTIPGLGNGKLVRRLTRVVKGDGIGSLQGMNNADKKYLEIVVLGSGNGLSVAAGETIAQLGGASLVAQFPIKDRITGTEGRSDAGLGTLQATAPWSLEGSQDLKEINLKVDSFSITARTRKLKAAWTPELGQDLNAYHNLDAEVELTSILSEQIGLEIDQEILNDLVKGATAGVKYWSRRPGKFVDRLTGVALGTGPQGSYAEPPDFTGNVSMWYETLLETVNDVSALIHRKTLRGGANFIVVSPEVANILEFTAGFRATVTHDSEKGSTGAVKVGALNAKFDVIVDPYFPRNVILVGRKGSSFLESGYVYAPYVPLQTSPTIFDPKDFTPRKAVMTRYGKAFVRPDMYGIVVIQDLNG
jgi:hypothetical protein